MAFVSACLLPLPGAGAPVTGRGVSEPGARGAEAERSALMAARHEALERALAGLDVAVDPTRAAAVLTAAEAWTGAYRILAREGLPDGRLELELEAEIDLARLAKRVAPSSEAAPRGLRVRSVEVDGACPASFSERAPLGDLLFAFDLGGEQAPREVELAFRCAEGAPVPATHQRSMRVLMVARDPRGLSARAEAWGFGPSREDAARAARHAALSRLEPRLRDFADAAIYLEVHHVGDATRVRRLEAALRERVRGVVEATLVSVDAGVVGLRVYGPSSRDELAHALAALRFPDFSYTVDLDDEPDTIRISLH